MERKTISKKIRFEVFKRDKFTCQYCGRKAPDVVLNVDHITPVAEGGTNDMLNLITACFSCNNGKRATPLDKNAALDKQRKQLEELQERREQIEMMFEWKQSLEDLSDYSTSLLVEYIESLITPHKIKEAGLLKVKSYLKQFGLDEVLEAVDISARQYIQYDDDGVVTARSAGDFFSKIGGIASNRRKTPIEQKCGYVAAICKNNFVYWDYRKGMAILANYVSALRDYGWSEEQIVDDLDTEVIKLAREAKNWSSWKSSMERWIADIHNWKKDEEIPSGETNENIEISINDIEDMSKQIIGELEDIFTLMEYVAIPFNVDCETIKSLLIANVRLYILRQIETLIEKPEEIEKWTPSYTLLRDLRFFDCVKTNESNLSPLTFRLNDMYERYILDIASQELYLENIKIQNEKDLVIFRHFFERDITELCKNRSIKIIWE